MKVKQLLFVLAFAIPAQVDAATWDIDTAHSHVGFSIKHMMVSNVRGAFGKVTGTLQLDDKNLAKSSVVASIDVSTIDTRDAKRDEHLRSADFFDVAKYPTIAFKSKGVKLEGQQWLITGDLTMHGVTREVVLKAAPLTAEIKDPWGMIRRGFSATATLNRKDFGISYNTVLDNGGVALSEEVTVTLDIELMRKSTPQG